MSKIENLKADADSPELDEICRKIEKAFYDQGLDPYAKPKDYAKIVAHLWFQAKGGKQMMDALRAVYDRAVKDGVVTKEDLKYSEIEKVREALKAAGFNMIDK